MERAPEQNFGDTFACMRSFFESFNKNTSKFRYQSSYLAVYETLYSYCERIGFRQYNPSKPAKYGLLYRLLCDATVLYTYFSSFFMITLSILSMAFPPLLTCLVATSLWIDILLLSH